MKKVSEYIIPDGTTYSVYEHNGHTIDLVGNAQGISASIDNIQIVNGTDAETVIKQVLSKLGEWIK